MGGMGGQLLPAAGTGGGAMASSTMASSTMASSSTGMMLGGVALGWSATDFSALDVNPNSPRFNQAVSPKDYATQVSGWYFGHAT